MKTVNHAFLIDDDAMINMINTKMITISKLAKKVSCHTDAKEALEKLNQLWLTSPDEFPEIIFLDINMPDMDGWDFLNAFKQFPREALDRCKVIMLTSSIDIFDIKKSKSFSIVNDYIIKPLKVKLLESLGSPKHKYFSISQSTIEQL
ncbi:MAG: response regulator [Sediminibacterium sp.]